MRQLTISPYIRIPMLLTCLFVIVLSCSFGRKQYGKWTVTSKDQREALPWAPFLWESDSMGGVFFDKYAMSIPAKIQGLPYTFTFQFDLGSNLTRLYSENIRSITAKHPGTDLKKITIDFGDFTASTPLCYIEKDYGESIDLDNGKVSRIGTIGSDLFQDKVLIIDYPGKRFCISDTIPSAYQTKMTDIALDKHGRIILPMLLNGRTFKVMFDNGSSIFSLLTSVNNIGTFSTEQDVDTLQVNAWGKPHLIIGRPMKDTMVLGGQSISGFRVYADQNDTGRTREYDAITGNALFWDKTVIIDLKNKKFGVKR